MFFNSLQYIFFLIAIVIAYYRISYRFRWILLLIGSYYFYMCWKSEYVVLILLTTLVNYFTALQMAKSSNVARRKLYLVISICVSLGVLFFFKYFNFLNDSARLVFSHFNLFYDDFSFEVLLPVGISFYTFQTLSYTIDVYRGQKEPERHLGIFALYVSFFPQLVAGPIERSTHLLPQFFEKHDLSYENFIEGSKRIVWGLFKKVVIADRLGLIVDQIYNQPTEHSGLVLIVATYCFAFQILCDFSGYTDIAIGSARLLGFRLMENFTAPYLARSIFEFWQRWHISLTTWFRDYLYVPLGGNRCSYQRWIINVLVVFLLSGLWHGANWTFVIWGFLHAVYYFCTKPFSRFSKRLRLKESFRDVLNLCVTFNAVVFAWIFFRANTVHDAFYIVGKIFSFGNLGDLSSFFPVMKIISLSVIVGIVWLKYFIDKSLFNENSFVYQNQKFANQFFYALSLTAILFLGVRSYNAFIYFQF